jgi:hypothetical protein
VSLELSICLAEVVLLFVFVFIVSSKPDDSVAGAVDTTPLPSTLVVVLIFPSSVLTKIVAATSMFALGLALALSFGKEEDVGEEAL